MKIADMDERQKQAYHNMINASNWLIGGLENTISDSEPNSKDQLNAMAQLKNHNELKNDIYNMTITDVYEEGSMCFNAGAKQIIKHIRFCGKEWIMERIERRLIKMGY